MLRLKQIRESQKISQQEMADRLGVKVRTYGSWEREEAPISFPVVTQCAEILGCTTDDIAGRIEYAVVSLDDGLSSDEQALVESYRACTRERQRIILMTARDMAGASREESERDPSVSVSKAV